MYKDLVTNCKAQEGASDADVQEMASHQLPSTRPGQCFNACVLENIGFVRRIFGILLLHTLLLQFLFLFLDKRWQIIGGRMCKDC